MFIHHTPAAFYGRGIKVTSDILEKWYSEFNGNIEEFQNYLLEQTFDNPLFVSWSLRIKYRESFLKTTIAWIEKYYPIEVNSRWYDLIADLASRQSIEQDWCHTIYILDNNQSVVHRQTTALLSHGLTGLSSWPAAICLGDYLMKEKSLLHGRIIELGAGSGLLGLALLKYSDEIISYTFTDYSSMILNLLRQNALLNFTEEQLNKRVHIEELDWNEFSFDKTDLDQFDLVLAADVVYDPSVINNLVKTIRILLETNRQCSVYIANAIRNDSTYAQFRQALNMTVFSPMNSHSSLHVHSIEINTSQSIEILRITLLNNR